MKRYVFFAALLFLTFSPIFSMEREVQELKLSNGIPVYYINNTENEIDAVCISVDGSINYLTPETSGLESVLFSLMATGSDKYSKEEIDYWKNTTKSTISSNSGMDNSILELICIDSYLDAGLDILSDSFMNPILSKTEFDKIMTNVNQRIQQTMNDPFSLGFYYARKIIYRNHPYEVSSAVTIDSVKNINLAEVKKHYKTILDNRRIKVFAVTKTDSQVLIEKLDSTIGRIGAQSYPLKKEEIRCPDIKEEPLVITNSNASGTGYILRFTTGPSFLSEDYIPTLLALQLYTQNCMNVVRGKYGTCYSPEVSSAGSKANFNYEVLYQCSNMEDFKEHLAEARNITAQGKCVTGTKKDGSFILSDFDEVLEGKKNSLINSTYQKQATTAGLLSRIMNSVYCYGNPTEINKRYEEIRNATSEQVLSAFRKYITVSDDFWLAVVGPEDEERVEQILNK